MNATDNDIVAGAADNVLEVTDLQVRFATHDGDLTAVNGVTFSLRRGRVLALVGESGCGKSVTSYAILRLIQPPGRIAGGSVVIRSRTGRTYDMVALGERSEDLFSVRGGVASMIFQEPMTALSPVHTVGNQICEALLLHRRATQAEAEETALSIMRLVGIPDATKRLRQYPHEFSGGMRQRVMIAMALACDPELLIADEPTTALDVTIQAQVLGLLKQLQQQKQASVLLITHDLGVVAQTAHDVAVMYLGRIVEHGPVRTVLKRPAHPYTRSLLQSLPSLHRRGERLQSIRGSVPGLNEIPPGCPFHPRCPHCVPGLCDAGTPPASTAIGEGHAAACLRIGDLP